MVKPVSLGRNQIFWFKPDFALENEKVLFETQLCWCCWSGTIHWDSLITAMLFMLNHSLGGLEGCRAISSDYVAIEAKVVAVMAYEFHHTLYVVNCDLSYSTQVW